MSDKEFWNLTPKEFDGLIQRHIASEERENLRSGLIAATILNLFLDKGREPIQPGDFFKEREEPKAQTWQEQLSVAEMMAAAGWGQVTKGTQ